MSVQRHVTLTEPIKFGRFFGLIFLISAGLAVVAWLESYGARTAEIPRALIVFSGYFITFSLLFGVGGFVSQVVGHWLERKTGWEHWRAVVLALYMVALGLTFRFAIGK